MKSVLMDKEDFKKISKEIDKAKGYYLGITIISKDDMLKHYLVSNNFPKIDLLKSWSKIKKLIIEDLEKDKDESFLSEVNF